VNDKGVQQEECGGWWSGTRWAMMMILPNSSEEINWACMHGWAEKLAEM
jgi:hypothetical protein